MSDFEIVAYRDPAHREYLITTFLESMRGPPDNPTWPWAFIPQRILEGRLFRAMRSPTAQVLVAVVHVPEDPRPVLGGWVVTRPQHNEIVAGYTRYSMRRKWGIGSSLAIAGGIDFEKPVGVWFWTYATERLFREHAGYGRLYHKVTDDPHSPRPGAAPRRPHDPRTHQGRRPPRGPEVEAQPPSRDRGHRDHERP